MSDLSPSYLADRIHPIEDKLRRGDLSSARTLLSQLDDPSPRELAALEARANFFQNDGKIAEASFLYLRLAELCPFNADVLYNLGNVLRLLGNYEEAADAFRKAIVRNANDFAARQQLGSVLCELGKTDEAINCFRRTLALKPDFHQVCIDLGNALRSQGQLAEALQYYYRAVEINPEFPLAQYNLGVGLMESGDLQAAITCFRQAMRGAPKLVEARWNCALCMLATANFHEGWPLFEARLEKAPASARRFSAPRWQGEDLTDKDLLVHAEQGFGDTLQFVRYLALLTERFKPRTLIFECQPELQRLLQALPSSMGVMHIVAGGVDPLPKFDLHIPLLSLPWLFKTTQETIPARLPYIESSALLTEKWAQRFSTERRRKVGIAWAGRATHANDAQRSMDAAVMMPLLDVADICFVSLQKFMPGTARPKIAGLIDHTDVLTDFAETAALVSQLDLVISVDTAVAHLAGAMGKPVWLLNACHSEWRWMRDRDDSPWYPGMTIFRQTQVDDWSSVLIRVADALRRFAA